IEALATLGGEESTDLLKRWLRRNRAAFEGIVDVEPVQKFLLLMLSDDIALKPEGWLAFSIIWSTPDRSLREEAEQFVRKNITYLGDDKLSELVELGQAALKILAYAAGNEMLHVKKRISSLIAKKLDKVLVPQGDYE